MDAPQILGMTTQPYIVTATVAYSFKGPDSSEALIWLQQKLESICRDLRLPLVENKATQTQFRSD